MCIGEIMFVNRSQEVHTFLFCSSYHVTIKYYLAVMKFGVQLSMDVINGV